MMKKKKCSFGLKNEKLVYIFFTLKNKQVIPLWLGVTGLTLKIICHFYIPT